MNLSCKMLTGVLASLMSASVSASDYKKELDCLTEAVYFESRSESYTGQLFVALVIKNRVEDSRWPDSYCGVVHQKHQFSYYWDGKKEVYKDLKAKKKAEQVANLVYYGTMIDVTEGADHYHTTMVRPLWDYDKLEPVAIIDNHIFYRTR